MGRFIGWTIFLHRAISREDRQIKAWGHFHSSFALCTSDHSLHCFHFSSFGFQLFFVNHFFSVFTFELSFLEQIVETDKHANKLIAPYRENYVHRVLFFYVRISLTSNDQGPAGPDPAGGPARPVEL